MPQAMTPKRIAGAKTWNAFGRSPSTSAPATQAPTVIRAIASESDAPARDGSRPLAFGQRVERLADALVADLGAC